MPVDEFMQLLRPYVEYGNFGFIVLMYLAQRDMKKDIHWLMRNYHNPKET